MFSFYFINCLFFFFYYFVLFVFFFFFFFQAEDGIRDGTVTGVQTCALPICSNSDALTPVASRRSGFGGGLGGGGRGAVLRQQLLHLVRAESGQKRRDQDRKSVV